MKAAVFVVGSLLLALLSRRSLVKPKSHGFFRFFAWEAILGLVLLNSSFWFQDPFSWHQIISWKLLTICILPLVLGVIGLRSGRQAKPRDRTEPELLGLERTTVLVKDGIYGLIRHPMYSSLLFLAWGLFFKEPSVPGVALAAAATALLVLTAKRDEAECIQVFGTAYRTYMQRTRMFVPYVV